MTLTTYAPRQLGRRCGEENHRSSGACRTTAASCLPAPSKLARRPNSLPWWSAFLVTAERGVYFATSRGSFIGPETALESAVGGHVERAQAREA